MLPYRSAPPTKPSKSPAAADIIAPVDSGEKSAVLTTKQLENYVQVGSNAAEYLKIMPGFGIQNGGRTSPITPARPSASMGTAMAEARAR